MKVYSVNEKLNSSYIYFKSSSKIKGMASNPIEDCLYDIPSKFNVVIKNDNGCPKISGRCGCKNYSLKIYNGEKTYMSGYISGNNGYEPLYISIEKNKGLFNRKTRISGLVGNKNIDMNCKTNYASQHITGKYNKEDVDVTIWESIMYDNIYVDGENISMTIDNEAGQVFGQSSLPDELLPVLTGLSLVKDNL